MTAANSGGQVLYSLDITAPAVLLPELGHSAGIESLYFDGAHVFSADVIGHWVLWDYPTATMAASGDTTCSYLGNCSLAAAATCNVDCPQSLRTDRAGANIVIRIPNGFEVLSMMDGQVLAVIPADAVWWRLAADGSYICAGNSTGLYAWSLTGQLLLSRSGDYSKALAFAAPGEIRLVAGPAGRNAVETVILTSGNSSISPSFDEPFASWFADGERFLAADLNGFVQVYSKTAVRQDAVGVLPSGSSGGIDGLGGSGKWFWSYANGKLTVYSVGASSSPAATYDFGYGATLKLSGNTLAPWRKSSVMLSGESCMVEFMGSTLLCTFWRRPSANPSAPRSLRSYVAQSVLCSIRAGLSLRYPRYPWH